MKKLVLITLCLALGIFCKTLLANDKFDQELADKLGADDYGMKMYVLVILTTGENEITDKDKLNQLFAGHFANMKRLAADGDLVVAGPFVDAKPKRGLFILNVDSIEKAEQLVNTDPAVQAGVLGYELSKLYSSAALLMVNENHELLQKKAM